MAGQRGRDVLTRIGDGGSPEAFETVAGIRARAITLSAGLVDATTAESADAWRVLIASAGLKRAEVTGGWLQTTVRPRALSGQVWKRRRQA